MRPTNLALLAGVALTLGAAPLAADWLVLRDGGRVETAGGWEVKGKLVVFKLADGTLSSLRLSAVDLPASEQATAEAARQREQEEAAARAPAAKRPPALVLTDADVPRAAGFADEEGEEPAAGDTAAPEEGEGGAEEASEEAGEGGGAKVAVVAWEQRIDAKGVHLDGEVRNDSDSVATTVAVTASLYDDGGGLLARAAAVVDKALLTPGESCGFRAFFPEIGGFADARFEVSSTHFDRSTPLAAGEAPTEPSP